MKERTLSVRDAKKSKLSPSKYSLPPQYPPRLPAAFWTRYFELYPDGHVANLSEKHAFNSAYEPSKYLLKNGQLCVNVSTDASLPIWRPSTGCDKFSADGKWEGMG